MTRGPRTTTGGYLTVSATWPLLTAAPSVHGHVISTRSCPRSLPLSGPLYQQYMIQLCRIFQPVFSSASTCGMYPDLCRPSVAIHQWPSISGHQWPSVAIHQGNYRLCGPPIVLSVALLTTQAFKLSVRHPSVTNHPNCRRYTENTRVKYPREIPVCLCGVTTQLSKMHGKHGRLVLSHCQPGSGST